MPQEVAESKKIKSDMYIFNTMSRRKERFIPLQEGQVKMYACGPTVYNFFHLGNGRMFVTFDLLRRFLEYIGYEVTFVQNFTDIDDKVIHKANEEGVSYKEIAERYIREYFYDADRLGVKHASIHPRATETMDEIIDMIGKLLEKGFCYVAGDGVYYETSKFSDYGKLSHVPLEELSENAGMRNLSHEQKRKPEDFAVWKLAKAGEPAWDSPWGAGRPGWHIECSAMNHKHLGETIDIHCGGKDLVFPHHENEIAQSEAANGRPFARYWMHNGFVNVDHEKMAKSTGNFFTVRDLGKRYPYETLRFFMISAQYRSPINFSAELLESAGKALERIKTSVANLRFALAGLGREGLVAVEGAEAEAAEEDALFAQAARARECFLAAMSDDLNTADALAAIFDLVSAANLALTALKEEAAVHVTALESALSTIEELMAVLGFALVNEAAIPEDVLRLVEERVQAKKDRNFVRADEIRVRVLELGYKIEDTPKGPKVSIS